MEEQKSLENLLITITKEEYDALSTIRTKFNLLVPAIFDCMYIGDYSDKPYFNDSDLNIILHSIVPDVYELQRDFLLEKKYNELKC